MSRFLAKVILALVWAVYWAGMLVVIATTYVVCLAVAGVLWLFIALCDAANRPKD